MDPPPLRPTARTQEVGVSYRDSNSPSRSFSLTRGQKEKDGSRSMSLQRRRQPEVLIPAFELKAAPRETASPTSIIMNSPSGKSSGIPVSTSTDGGRTVLQEVHKIILSDVSAISDQGWSCSLFLHYIY
jgi:hypothetical protein